MYLDSKPNCFCYSNSPLAKEPTVKNSSEGKEKKRDSIFLSFKR